MFKRRQMLGNLHELFLGKILERFVQLSIELTKI